MDWGSRIEIATGRLGGKPVVRGSRVPVEMVVEMVADGWDATRIRASYPTLQEDDVKACLHYAASVLREEKWFGLPAAE